METGDKAPGEEYEADIMPMMDSNKSHADTIIKMRVTVPCLIKKHISPIRGGT